MQALESMKVAGFQVVSLIHIGANDGQERYEYLESGASSCVYVEPINDVFARLKDHIKEMPGHRAVQAVCSDTEGEDISFNIASNGGLSSSILGLGAHAEFHPSITYTSTQKMTTTTVDKLVSGLRLSQVPNLMIIDTQGAELKVLRGATELLKRLDGLFVEVSEAPLYEGGCTHEEITGYLNDFGFKLRWMSLNAHGHGDAFYCRGFDAGDSLPRYNGNMALKKPAEQSSLSQWSTSNDAAGAVNGRKNGGYGFHTDFQDRPWWQVDLGAKRSLSEIRIYNRIDVARERARSLRISVSVDKASWKEVHDQKNDLFGGVDGRPLRVYCSGTSARWIRLQLGETTALHLDEVEVY